MTPNLATALVSFTHWSMVLVTLVLVGMVVSLHYETLERLNHWIPQWGVRARPRILLLIFSILLVHTAEIWLFGIAIFMVVQFPDLGQISGVQEIQLLDAVYLSASTFTTVGYGDLAPHGAIRFLMGSEALTGFVLITWSASFTYLEMQRYWRPR